MFICQTCIIKCFHFKLACSSVKNIPVDISFIIENKIFLLFQNLASDSAVFVGFYNARIVS